VFYVKSILVKVGLYLKESTGLRKEQGKVSDLDGQEVKNVSFHANRQAQTRKERK
jgi:hypothetical protein